MPVDETVLDLVIHARRMVTAAGEHPGWVGVRDGRIAVIGTPDRPPIESAASDTSTGSDPVIIRLADDEVLMPGLVDSHVHVNEPGRTHWEGFTHAGRAAAAGGTTTIVDMPLNSLPPTTTRDALRAKRERASGATAVDVGFWGGAVPGNLGELGDLVEAGVLGFKCFLSDSGVPEFGRLDDRELHRTLGVLRDLDSPLLVHAEDAELLRRAPAASGRSYQGFRASRPPEVEVAAVAQVIRAGRSTGGRAHIVHLSSAAAVPLLRAAKDTGVRITAETCPHYLFFTAGQIADGATVFKCCPPIRGAADREALWEALAEGVIDCVVSDHSPCTADLKRLDTGDFGQAWGGIAGLQLRLSVLWTEASGRGFTLTDVARWVAGAPAELAGLSHRKGAIAVGRDADLCAFAPGEQFTVNSQQLHHRNPLSPYEGAELAGAVRRVWLRGVPICTDQPQGRLLSGRDHTGHAA